jgi:hypothetical protein
MITSFDKALVPIVVAGILFAVATFGILPGMTVEDALTLAVTSALVWLVPNRKK